MTPARTRVALLIASAWGSTAAIALYALLRIGQVILTREPDPATVIYGGDVGYFWRAASAAFGGALLAFPAFLIARSDAAASARGLALALTAASLLLAAQSAVAP